MAHLLRFDLLGQFRVQTGDRVITRFATQKAGALLAYLAFHPEPQPREILVEILWPDGLPEAGRGSLNQALSTLRRQVEPPGVLAGGVIVSTKTHVGLSPEAIQTDVGEFQKALRKARLGAGRTERIQALQDAVELYGGDLLPGFYEDWVQIEQRRLAGLYFQAVESLTALLEEGGELPEALEYARRALSVDRVREESYQQVMRLCAAAGQPGAALEQYRALEKALDEELGAEPSQATRTLAQEIERIAVAPVRASTGRRRAPRSQLPRGTVTFLMTDIEGSTALWEKTGASFQRALESHHTLLRRQFRAHHGHEVKEGGDSFMVAFETATEAVTCAIACQLALAGAVESWSDGVMEASLQDSTTPSLQLKVRMALYTGEVKLEDGEYHGFALHRASRMLTAAHGGQIICSESTASLSRRDLREGVRLVDLGVFRLRDVQAPERLFQVNYDGMPRTDFPPLRAEAGYQSNLPLQFTRFFGREEQLAQIGEMLKSADTRLVTITGTGGTGKTRLALEAGNRLLEPFAGAVWFVPLVDLSDPRLIAGAIVDSLRIARSPTAEPLDQAVEALNRQPSLLILDNLEQFVEEGGRVVHTLLERVPLLTCLVTSRQSLSVVGEREYQLAPLATPNGPGTPERLTMFESVRLFVDRAQAVRPDFQVTNQNAPSVAELCDRLEGIPLAIELAAARASVLSPSQMILQLENRFDFLVSRRRDAAAHHETLRAAMDWSYDLLPPEVQRFFARLSVFRGGWTVEAAEAVCEEPLALDYLGQLRDCSLILAEESSDGMRFRILVTIQEIGQEKLSLEERAALALRHLVYFLTFAEEVAPKLPGPEQGVWLHRLEAEHDNLRAALDRSQTDEEGADTGMRLAGVLCQFWAAHGHWAEGRQRLASALGRTQGPVERTTVRARAWYAAGNLAWRQGDYASAYPHLQEALTAYRELADKRGTAVTLESLGIVARFQGECALASALHKESLAIWEELGDRIQLAWQFSNLGAVARMQGDYEAMHALYEQSLAIHRELDYRPGIADALSSLGMVARVQDNYAAARSLYEESLAIRRQLRDDWGAAWSLNNLGVLSYYEGDYAAARTLHKESLIIRGKLGDTQTIAQSLQALGSVAVAQEQLERAARLLGTTDALRDAIGSPLPPDEREEFDRTVAATRTGLGEKAFEAAWGEGRKMTIAHAEEYALQESA